MNYLVCYDITDNKLRKKIADKLIFYGLARVQLSVFIGYVTDLHFEKMRTVIEEKMKEKTEKDSIVFLRINAENLKKMIIFGKLLDNTSYVTENGHTIFF